LPNVPKDQINKIARFLDAQGLPDQALKLSTDADHRFELAIQLKQLKLAVEILGNESFNEPKWRQVGDAALSEYKVY
jgi:coatomer subunit beta'